MLKTTVNVNVGSSTTVDLGFLRLALFYVFLLSTNLMKTSKIKTIHPEGDMNVLSYFCLDQCGGQTDRHV